MPGSRPARPVPFVTTDPPAVDWSSKDSCREYLREAWNGNMCTAHGALSCEYPAQAFEFTEYHWLFLAYKTLGMPNCNTEDAFNHCYLRDYLGQYTVEYFNFWEEYCVTLAGRYNSSTERNAMDKEEKRTARRWMNWQERQEEREEEEREERLASGEPDPVSWRRTLEMTTGEEQIVWDQLADEREAREDANVEE